VRLRRDSLTGVQLSGPHAQEALCILGFGPCYHMFEVPKNKTHPGLWLEAVEAVRAGKDFDFQQVRCATRCGRAVNCNARCTPLAQGYATLSAHNKYKGCLSFLILSYLFIFMCICMLMARQNSLHLNHKAPGSVTVDCAVIVESRVEARSLRSSQARRKLRRSTFFFFLLLFNLPLPLYRCNAGSVLSHIYIYVMSGAQFQEQGPW
jgi:hypothetical protein